MGQQLSQVGSIVQTSIVSDIASDIIVPNSILRVFCSQDDRAHLEDVNFLENEAILHDLVYKKGAADTNFIQRHLFLVDGRVIYGIHDRNDAQVFKKALIRAHTDGTNAFLLSSETTINTIDDCTIFLCNKVNSQKVNGLNQALEYSGLTLKFSSDTECQIWRTAILCEKSKLHLTNIPFNAIEFSKLFEYDLIKAFGTREYRCSNLYRFYYKGLLHRTKNNQYTGVLLHLYNLFFSYIEGNSWKNDMKAFIYFLNIVFSDEVLTAITLKFQFDPEILLKFDIYLNERLATSDINSIEYLAKHEIITHLWNSKSSETAILILSFINYIKMLGEMDEWKENRELFLRLSNYPVGCSVDHPKVTNWYKTIKASMDINFLQLQLLFGKSCNHVAHFFIDHYVSLGEITLARQCYCIILDYCDIHATFQAYDRGNEQIVTTYHLRLYSEWDSIQRSFEEYEFKNYNNKVVQELLQYTRSVYIEPLLTATNVDKISVQYNNYYSQQHAFNETQNSVVALTAPEVIFLKQVLPNMAELKQYDTDTNSVIAPSVILTLLCMTHYFQKSFNDYQVNMSNNIESIGKLQRVERRPSINTDKYNISPGKSNVLERRGSLKSGNTSPANNPRVSVQRKNLNFQSNKVNRITYGITSNPKHRFIINIILGAYVVKNSNKSVHMLYENETELAHDYEMAKLFCQKYTISIDQNNFYENSSIVFCSHSALASYYRESILMGKVPLQNCHLFVNDIVAFATLLQKDDSHGTSHSKQDTSLDETRRLFYDICLSCKTYDEAAAAVNYDESDEGKLNIREKVLNEFSHFLQMEENNRSKDLKSYEYIDNANEEVGMYSENYVASHLLNYKMTGIFPCSTVKYFVQSLRYMYNQYDEIFGIANGASILDMKESVKLYLEIDVFNKKVTTFNIPDDEYQTLARIPKLIKLKQLLSYNLDEGNDDYLGNQYLHMNPITFDYSDIYEENKEIYEVYSNARSNDTKVILKSPKPLTNSELKSSIRGVLLNELCQRFYLKYPIISNDWPNDEHRHLINFLENDSFHNYDGIAAFAARVKIVQVPSQYLSNFV